MPAWILGAYAAVGAAIVLAKWLTNKNRKLRAEIQKVPCVALRDAPEGVTTRISGVLRYTEGDRLRAPISGRPCAAWHVVVWRLEGGKNKSWREKLDEQESQDFLLTAEEELAYVDGTYLDMLLHADAKEENRFLAAPTPAVEAFLTSRHLELQGLLFKHAYRVHEGILEEGERVTVVGQGSWEPDPSRRGQGYRDVGKRFHIEAMDDGRLLASDEQKLAADD